MSAYREKPVTDAQTDLSLYIEGLLTVDAEQSEAEQTITAMDLVETEVDETVSQHTSLNAESNYEQDLPNNLDCLHFIVDDTSFMMPATKIASLEKLTRSLTRLPLLPAAIKGMLTVRGSSIPVIDLLSLMNNDDQITSAGVDHHQEDTIQFAIVIEGADYAIACNTIGAIETIPAGNIRWNNSSANNCLYSGIIATRLCPLLDVDRITESVKTLSITSSHGA